MASAARWRYAGLGLVVCLLALGCSSKKVAGKAPSPTPSAGESAAAEAPTAPGPTCPLTGAPASSGVPSRPVFAVKVPNDTQQARGFQTGLNAADIVYEEPVEGGITRFIALYQCQDAARVEPVRSARFVDLDVLQQYGKVLFGHAGGIQQVINDVGAAAAAGKLIDANYSGTPYQGDYHRDGSRAEPDNLYTSTAEIYKTFGTAGTPPAPVFTYVSATSTVGATPSASGVSATAEPGSGAGSVVNVPFSSAAYNPTWTWNAATAAYLRSYGAAPHKLTDGSQIKATNVVIQLVSVTPSQYAEDITGTKENLVGTTGTGKAIVCRLGACVTGTWSRPSLSTVTQYLDPSGAQIPLAPGPTWVELEPNNQTPSMS